MDVDYFFKSRTTFIVRFYDNAIKTFKHTQEQIEKEEEPYVPPYSEDPEPAFLEEWLDADASIQVVGQTAISLLSESLKAYFIEWDSILGTRCAINFKGEFKSGFWTGYRKCFQMALGINWNDCPADKDVIEQVILARNSSQHADAITSMVPKHPKDLRARFPNPLFVREYERNLSKDDLTALAWLGTQLEISREALTEAVRQAELLVDWLEPQLQKARWS